MAHFIGKLNFSKLIGVKVADVEYPDRQKKCLVVPIEDNDIKQWKDEWQLWFRAFAYRSPLGKFTHFLMKYIPIGDIKRMSQSQIEAFANHKIGGMYKTKYASEKEKDLNSDIE